MIDRLLISPNVTHKITVSQTPIIPASEIGEWLNLGPGVPAAQEDMINQITNATTEILERYLWLNIWRTTYEAYYYLDSNYFCDLVNGNLALSVERSPIITINDITKIEYLLNDIWNEFDRGTKSIDGLFDNTTEKLEQRGWASVYFDNGIEFQNRINSYKVRITFTAGFDDTDPVYFIPASLKLAIKKIVAFHYTNRGDCVSECNIDGYPVPCMVMPCVNLWSIKETILGGEYNPV